MQIIFVLGLETLLSTSDRLKMRTDEEGRCSEVVVVVVVVHVKVAVVMSVISEYFC